ncbi:MAG: hypothetical protein HY909_16290 [Deltaproteobacteria bacterium]|nr:hypothetical protein [Deltaproteobacteria bacterium]
MPRWTHPRTGQQHELVPVHIERADPIEGALHLEDGTTLYVRMVPTEVVKADGATDEFDRPIYFVNSQSFVTVRKAPSQ